VHTGGRRGGEKKRHLLAISDRKKKGREAGLRIRTQRVEGNRSGQRFETDPVRAFRLGKEKGEETTKCRPEGPTGGGWAAPRILRITRSARHKGLTRGWEEEKRRERKKGNRKGKKMEIGQKIRRDCVPPIKLWRLPSRKEEKKKRAEKTSNKRAAGGLRPSRPTIRSMKAREEGNISLRESDKFTVLSLLILKLANARKIELERTRLPAGEGASEGGKRTGGMAISTEAVIQDMMRKKPF